MLADWRPRSGVSALAGTVALLIVRAPSLVSNEGIQRHLVDSPSTGFEDVRAAGAVSSDNRWAIYAPAHGATRVIDLQSGRDDPSRLPPDVMRVRTAAFAGQSVALRGDEGWFVTDSEGVLRLTGLPPDARVAWSGDGKSVAYDLPAQDGALFVGTIERANPVALPDRVTGFAWAPDAQSVFTMTCDGKGVSRLFRVMLGTQPMPVLVADDLDADCTSAPLSTDGRRVFLALAGGHAVDPRERHEPLARRELSIYELDLATGTRRGVVMGGGDNFAPVWIDGHLYWTRATAHSAVAVMPAAGGAVQSVAEGAQLPSWSPDARQIGFTSSRWQLVDFGLDIGAGVVLVDSPGARTNLRGTAPGDRANFTPFWSPNGQWIAYQSRRSPEPAAYYDAAGSTDGIWLRQAKAAPSDDIQLTDIGAASGSLDWSPDGRSLIFSSVERSDSGASVRLPWIVRIDPSSGRALGVEKLPLPLGVASADWVAWSPNPDLLAIETTASPGRHALWIVRTNGASARKVVEYPSLTPGGVAWRPDGRELVYSALVDGRMQLFAVPVTGGTPRQLTRDVENVTQPRVSPDGQRIAATRSSLTKEILHLRMP